MAELFRLVKYEIIYPEVMVDPHLRCATPDSVDRGSSWPRIRWTRPFNQPNGTWINTAEESDLPKVFRTSLCTQRTRSGKGSGKSKSCGKGLQGQEFHGMYQTWITFRKTGKHRNIMRHPKRSFERWNLRKGNLLTHADSAEDHPSG